MTRLIPALLLGCASATTDEDSPTLPTGPCPAYFPVHLTETHDFATIAAYHDGDGTVSTTFQGEQPDGTFLVEEFEVYNQDDGDIGELESTTIYECDEQGVWLVSVSSRGRFVGNPWDNHSVEALSPWLVFPADPQDGWTSTRHARRSDFGSVSIGTDTVPYEVLGTDSVVTPAGTFDTLRVREERGQVSITTHYARGVGPVLVEQDLELVSITP